jgi:DNA-binding winged helix-turn-helix (wHTH) protein
LREKIEADPSDPKLVLTVPRTGYLFAGDSAGTIAGEMA